MTGNNFKNKSAFSLLETLVAVAIFAVIVLSSSQIFQSVLNSQKTNTVDQDVQENIKYFLEIFTRETQMAQRNTTGMTQCLVDPGHIFAANTPSSTELYFKNSDGQCVQYYAALDGGVNRLKISRDSSDDYITSPNVLIKNLAFAVDDSISTSTPTQPLVTVNVQVQSENNPNLAAYNIQTSISPRSWQ